MDAWIPYAVVGVGVFSVFIMLGVLGRAGLGPLAHLVAKPSVQNPSLQAENKRSLDADEEA